jgi:hypothetical protein
LLALAVALSMLGDAATTWAQAAPVAPAPPSAPSQAPAPAYPGNAPPPTAAPTYPQQQYPQQQYPQQAYPQQQGAPPPAGYAPQQSPLVGQPGQQGYAQPGYVQPGYVQPQGQWQPPRHARPRKGLMIAGIAVFGGFYVVSTFVGSALMDDDSSWDNHNDVGRLLFVPLLGPWIAMKETSEGDWGLWWLGMGQVAGAGMMVGGIIQYVNSKRRAQAEGFAQWQLPHGRKLSLDMATSPQLTGPRMRVSF